MDMTEKLLTGMESINMKKGLRVKSGSHHLQPSNNSPIVTSLEQGLKVTRKAIINLCFLS